jgi:hypothetical protein
MPSGIFSELIYPLKTLFSEKRNCLKTFPALAGFEGLVVFKKEFAKRSSRIKSSDCRFLCLAGDSGAKSSVPFSELISFLMLNSSSFLID